ncbi:hypothetical protein [Algoriphagus sanaruensis]|uniref:Uncharacterized protein n=1 Tax=Algoriphagus sanaruensis TaxID=1727163 RepID=A0A142EMV4_9BACT|nr:hypothetical protein [Algoriphagus sanaruensis]AMQ56459.1 hypothetical protein AO498_08525 [Algoriphagus sanaruensis]
MTIRKLVKESINMLDKSDKGIIFQDFDHQVVHVADAAFYGKQVYPKDLVKTLNENFNLSGFPLDDASFRKELLELIDKYEYAVKHRPKKKGFELDEDFGKIV